MLSNHSSMCTGANHLGVVHSPNTSPSQVTVAGADTTDTVQPSFEKCVNER